jgi:hypothetical protein
VDLDGGTLLPGFIDAHAHPVFAGNQMRRCDLRGADTADGYLEIIAGYAREHPDEAWITGGGWAMAAFPGGIPSRETLDAVTGDRPTFLPNRDGHGAWVNSAALRVAGIDASTPDPTDGRIERDAAAGQTTGDIVIDVSAADDAAAAVAAHLGHGDVASLELSLLAPLPHVTVGSGLDVAARPASPSGTRVVRGRTGDAVELPVLTLLDQAPGARGAGPAVVEGPFFTMRLPEGWQFQITAAGDLLLADHHTLPITGSH